MINERLVLIAAVTETVMVLALWDGSSLPLIHSIMLDLYDTLLPKTCKVKLCSAS